MFSKNLTGPEGQERHLVRTRIFLSRWHHVEETLKLGKKKGNPCYVDKYNTLGLLRIAATFDLCDLVRNTHEGGQMGEGIVKSLRELCPTVARDGWSANLVSAYYREETLATFLLDMGVQIPTWNKRECDTKADDCRRYKTIRRDGSMDKEHPKLLQQDVLNWSADVAALPLK